MNKETETENSSAVDSENFGETIDILNMIPQLSESVKPEAEGMDEQISVPNVEDTVEEEGKEEKETVEEGSLPEDVLPESEGSETVVPADEKPAEMVKEEDSANLLQWNLRHMYDRVKSSSSEILGGNEPTSKDIKKAKKVRN